MAPNSQVDIADLDGSWMHHVENLVDFCHIFFIHKNRNPFKHRKYANEGPFSCKQYTDKRGFGIVTHTFAFLRY